MAQKHSRTLLIFTLGLLTSIGPFSIDMYLPGFPEMAIQLNTTVATVSLSLSSFFIGIAGGQLVYGPLLDRFGRKKPMMFGLVVYLLATIGCIFAGTVHSLIIWRFFQALGGCVGMVASRAMVRDLFPVTESAKIFSMLMLVVGVSPIIAPSLGGFVTATIGWRYVFVILFGMALGMLILVWFTLAESRKPDPGYSLRPRSILKGYARVFKDPQFFTYSLTGSMAAAGLYAYISGSPFVFMEILKTSEQQYGWIFAFVAGGLITATQINNRLLRKYSSQQIIPVALIIQATAGVSLAAGAAFGLLNLYGYIFFILVFLSCQGFTFPNSSALSMAPFTRNAGSASALMGGIQMAIGASTSALVGLFNDGSAMPMTFTMAGCSILSLLFLFTGIRVIRYKAKMADIEEQATELASTT